MERRTRKIRIASQVYTLHSLFPADFLPVKFWPFSYYRLPEDLKPKPAGPNYDWKIKPKKMIDTEDAIKTSIRRAFEISAGLLFDKCDRALESETVKNILLTEIYALTYGLDSVRKLMMPFEMLYREQAEMIYIKAKAYNAEPFAQMADLVAEPPELYNPRRYDFNLFILGCGWERERREAEKIKAEMSAKFKTGKR